MVVQAHQCIGTTTKGQRCKISVGTKKGYCSYHSHQAGKQFHPLPAKLPLSVGSSPKKTKVHCIGSFEHDQRVDKGYIYVYTMRNFISPPKDWDFQVKNVPQTSKRHRDKWISFKSIKSPYILIKVGMTTQLPNVRIKQWELKCKHELVNMGPANSHLAKPHLSWWQRMANLSLEDGQRVDATYRNLQNEGFYCNGNLKNVEMAIHSKLRANYGKGDVFCSGCVSDDDLTVNKSTKAVPLRHNFKVHVEWFLVPKTDLTSVYKLIDETCNAHARAN